MHEITINREALIKTVVLLSILLLLPLTGCIGNNESEDSSDYSQNEYAQGYAVINEKLKLNSSFGNFFFLMELMNLNKKNDTHNSSTYGRIDFKIYYFWNETCYKNVEENGQDDIVEYQEERTSVLNSTLFTEYIIHWDYKSKWYFEYESGSILKQNVSWSKTYCQYEVYEDNELKGTSIVPFSGFY